MGFRFKRSESVADGVVRIGREQTQRALRSLDRHPTSPTVAIHDARKRSKKLRSLLRLARGPLGNQFRPADRAARSLGRGLAGHRHADALLAALDVGDRAGVLSSADRATIRAELTRRATEASGNSAEAGSAVDGAVASLTSLADQIESWTFSANGWTALAEGFEATRSKGDAALALALGDPTVENLHSYRRHAIRAWHQLRLVEPSAPSLLGPLAQRYDELTDALGDAHDLALLADTLRTDAESFGGDDVSSRAAAALDTERAELERRCLALAFRLHGDRPDHVAGRVGVYFDAWVRFGRELPVVPDTPLGTGAIADRLDGCTVTELRSLARTHDLPGRSGLRRDGLIDLLRHHGVDRPTDRA